MSYSILPHSDINRGFEAYPNHLKNFGWVSRDGHCWVFPKHNGDGVNVDTAIGGSFLVSATPSLFRLAIDWTVPAGSVAANVRWQFAYKIIRGNNVSLDFDLFTAPGRDELVQGAIAAPPARTRLLTLVSLSNLIQKGDRIIYALRRNATHAQDTFASEALVIDAVFDDGA